MNIGFIGAGHMGSAMIKGLLRAKVVEPEALFVKGGSSGATKELQQECGFQLVNEYQVFSTCSILFIATGATIALKVLEEVSPILAKDTTVISVASGHTIDEMQQIIGNESYAIHAVPNVPVSVNAGVIGTVFGQMPKENKTKALSILQTLGKVEEVNESLFGIFGTVAGCSPAFVAVFMEALSDGAVREGLQRELSYEVIAQMMLGTAQLAIESTLHPGELKDSVTSPGGSTIKGVEALEQNNFRYGIMNAIKQANQ